MHGPLTVRRAGIRWSTLLLGLVLASLLVHAAGVLLDFRAAIGSPLGLDYGEGIVWQQLALFGTDRAYSADTALPFIVFHYPPLYYLLVRAVEPMMASPLAAGRLVAMASASLLPLLVAACVVLASPPGGDRRRVRLAALLAGLLVFCSQPVHMWGLLMRVDMPGLVFGVAGLLVAMRAEGRFAGTAVALLLCTCAVFTKQTLLSYGVAVFLLSAARRPRSACLAALLVGTAGGLATLILQRETAGGFLLNIIGYNINRYELAAPFLTIVREGPNLVVLVLCTTLAIAVGRHALKAARLRDMDRTTWRRALLACQCVLAFLTLITLFKVGSSTNYLLDWAVGVTALAGIAFADPGILPQTERARAPLLATLLASIALQPIQFVPRALTPQRDAEAARAVAMIRAARRPVASEDMTLTMRAGREIVYEPAIATELASLHRWDETPLVSMIRHHGFAFMITVGWPATEDHTTPAVKAAMEEAYPVVQWLGPSLVLHTAQAA